MQVEMLTGRNLKVWNTNQPANPSTLSLERGSTGVIRSERGYKGNKFDPDYHKKQQKQHQNYHTSQNYYQNNNQPYGYNNRNNAPNQNHSNFFQNHGTYTSNRGNGRGGNHQNSIGRGNQYHQSGERPSIGPGSFNRLMSENNVTKGAENGNVPTASSSK
ncbi:uncharacterized protein MELLADRAFT_108375 [Melampsora larici-populina 98AG31]|uniref:Uncharacterized protein n=1 Tax=Melampsora larici-populina (strain 98AG31 / pathotype 3-4-7) TaxID=747676 RepID=F4RSW7_MELLP|nr:uncharacterized protein MELLADRAFT_108375 [Melampsora larici-populina 98AG31]EGG04531.1 hypothetical protein MELLADRAFT_108375 [Melampsora larici-populina 98AG31]